MKKKWQRLLSVLVPAILAIGVSLWFHWPYFITTAGIYVVLLIFMIPSDSLFSSTMDYQAKSLNPTFRPKRLPFKVMHNDEWLDFLVVVAALIVCLLSMYVATFFVS
ncbi:hypothetical protein IV487_12460 [Enterococcus saccharolyticus]|uniref:1,4-dihydroxy-2-naphthoate octaprenyltransferase n=1 Tax=Candidatus Enterococcus willemsii TaxID=1857215 RepID=A0ABQ6YZ70_9ENTE|nr:MULTISPECIES: hypothetical protein [Enterococcus]KAF1303751.1 hypothetical protein BAU17_11230 [Enterococcus sp. CU12B]MCD5003276.1 hypothetical protein [Enterococcus saccharolyticus]